VLKYAQSHAVHWTQQYAQEVHEDDLIGALQ